MTVATGRGRPLLADVVRSELKRLILGGEFAVGEKLPNEDRLCERFGVSRVTIREAVRGLIEDGLVVRRHGSGTYVTRRPLIQNSLDVNFSYTDHFAASGFRPGRKLLGMRTIPAGEDDAATLDIPVGTRVREVRRVRTADGRPAIYSIDRIPLELLRADLDRPRRGGPDPDRRGQGAGEDPRRLAGDSHPGAAAGGLRRVRAARDGLRRVARHVGHRAARVPARPRSRRMR
jgi:DNA-binding transcriptional regulator YhcF (GntR family)